MPQYYFEHGPSPRRVVALDRRDAFPQLGITYVSVAEEMAAEELTQHELNNRLRGIHSTIKRRTKALAKGDGERGGPVDERERGKWEREVLFEQGRIPHLERMLELGERRLAMLHAVLAGKQSDDRLPPPKSRPALDEDSAPTPAEPAPVRGAHEVVIDRPASGPATRAGEEIPLIDEDGKTEPAGGDRVAAVARDLDRLLIPTDLGRTKVRELLEQRDPAYRVNDAVLNAAIQSRRPAPAIG